VSPALKPPYIRKEDRRGDVHIYIVDGKYIRGHIDEEFSNFGQHYRFKFIPENEIWLATEADQNERAFFIDHAITERRLMADGMPYSRALGKADRAEKAERRRAGDIRKATPRGRKTSDPAAMHKHLWKKLKGGVDVWIVKGRLVRSAFFTDFTAGGHEYVYDFVPAGEVWIDDDIQDDERRFVVLHELHERKLMARGMPYDRAHALSSRMELRCRHHPTRLESTLRAQGWA
jgi:hypothetical protein